MAGVVCHRGISLWCGMYGIRIVRTGFCLGFLWLCIKYFMAVAQHNEIVSDTENQRGITGIYVEKHIF